MLVSTAFTPLWRTVRDMRLCGIDHVDVRVSSLAAVERFYDELLPVLGLPRKTESHVGLDGEWRDVDALHARNVIEYSTPIDRAALGWFIGFIEDATTTVNKTRIAFALDSEDDLVKIEILVRAAGGRVVEWSSEEKYPALFFEDPSGTRLEICARRPPQPTQ